MRSAGSPENRGSQLWLLVVLRVARRKERGVVPDVQPIPLQLLPPVLLAVDGDKTSILTVAGSGWEAPQAPAAPETDSLELGSEYFSLANLLQAEQIMQAQVLELWEFKHAILMLGSYFTYKPCLHWEDLFEITAADYVEGLQAG